jgi:hypothetical protein
MILMIVFLGNGDPAMYSFCLIRALPSMIPVSRNPNLSFGHKKNAKGPRSLRHFNSTRFREAMGHHVISILLRT